jgi:hypothetical protein
MKVIGFLSKTKSALHVSIPNFGNLSKEWNSSD